MLKKAAVALALAAVAPSVSAFAGDDATPVEHAYKNLVHPHRSPVRPHDAQLAHSDLEAMLAKMTPVRNQGQREDCSMFSATAMLESMLVIKKGLPNTIDLSEEWLEYLVMNDRDSDGSSSPANFAAYAQYGFANESSWQYLGEEWEQLSFSDLAQNRCGTIPESYRQSCLLGHRDPRLLGASDAELSTEDPTFLAIRNEAKANAAKYLADAGTSYSVDSVDDVKALLRQGIPVTLDLEFYYGAWNHRTAVSLGINRDMNNWDQGIVGYPEEGSMDREKSPTERAGHSVLVVGYDDNVEVTTHQLMTDGTTKDFTYKGVYYFKNSWDVDALGAQFTVNGVAHPGYAMITQKYAEEFGEFFQFPLK